MEQNESFEFTYCASEQEEIRKIREKYLSHDEREGKLEQLRRLDAGVGKKAAYLSILAGFISTLVFGLGMCCCLVWTQFFSVGIVIGIIGMIGIGGAFPLYNRIIEKERQRIAPQILKLADELMR